MTAERDRNRFLGVSELALSLGRAVLHHRTYLAIGAFLTTAALLAAFVVLSVGSDDASALPDIQADPAATPVSSLVEPNTVLRRVEHTYRRHGPHSDVMLANGEGPERQVIETLTTFGADGCVSEIRVVRTTETGEFLREAITRRTTVTQRSASGSERTYETGLDIGSRCATGLQERRASVFPAAQALPGARLGDTRDDDVVVVLAPIGLEVVATSDVEGRIKLPYAADLGISELHMFHTFDAETLEPAGRGLVATLTNGDEFILEERKVILEEVLPSK